MNDFELYSKEGKVKRQTPDFELARSLLADSITRIDKIKKLEINEFSKIIFENAYDAIRDILDALLAVDGYKSYSHEASIAYLKKYAFEDSTLRELDDFRYTRNSSKYYGKDVSEDDAREILSFYQKYSEKIILIAKDKCPKKWTNVQKSGQIENKKKIPIKR